MNIETILLIARLIDLIDRAREAGLAGKTWWSTLMQLHEPLSRLAGRGAEVEELQTSRAYEVCRAAIHRAWAGQPINVDNQPALLKQCQTKENKQV